MSQTSPQIPASTNLQLSNSHYDFLKRAATVLLPGLGALYFTLAQIWGLPAAEQVVGTISAVNLFIGLVVGLSTRSYNDDQFAGSIDIKEVDGVKSASLSFDGFPEDLAQQKEVKFRVNGY